MKRTREIHRQDPIPLVSCVLAEVRFRGYAGVGDENVWCSNSAKSRIQRFAIGDVRRAGLGSDSPCSVPGILTFQIENVYGGAMSRQELGGSEPHTVGTAADHGPFAFASESQICHIQRNTISCGVARLASGGDRLSAVQASTQELG